MHVLCFSTTIQHQVLTPLKLAFCGNFVFRLQSQRKLASSRLAQLFVETWKREEPASLVLPKGNKTHLPAVLNLTNYSSQDPK